MTVSHFSYPGMLLPQSPQSRRKTLAVGLSVAAHVAIGLILIRYSFIIHLPAADPQRAVIQTEILRLYNPPPTKTPAAVQPPATPFRPPLTMPDNPPMVIPAPANDAPQITDAGPTTLPTAPASPGPAIAGAGQGPAVAPVATPLPKPPAVIRSPSWLRQPSADQTSRAYPPRALEAGVGGSATINCQVLATGLVNDCQITTESPRGDGFGQAAVQLSRFFMLNPRTEDGKVVEGSRVNIPLSFKPPSD